MAAWEHRGPEEIKPKTCGIALSPIWAEHWDVEICPSLLCWQFPPHETHPPLVSTSTILGVTFLWPWTSSLPPFWPFPTPFWLCPLLRAPQSSSEQPGALGRSELPPHHLFWLFLLFSHEHLTHPLEFPILWQPFMPHHLPHNCIFHFDESLLFLIFPILPKHLFPHGFQLSPFPLLMSRVLTPSPGQCSPFSDKFSSHPEDLPAPSSSHISGHEQLILWAD